MSLSANEAVSQEEKMKSVQRWLDDNDFGTEECCHMLGEVQTGTASSPNLGTALSGTWVLTGEDYSNDAHAVASLPVRERLDDDANPLRAVSASNDAIWRMHDLTGEGVVDSFDCPLMKAWADAMFSTTSIAWYELEQAAEKCYSTTDYGLSFL